MKLKFAVHALIGAGGKGTRIKSKTPKQFIELNGKPVLLHTLEAFCHYSDSINIILVLPEDDFETWNTIARKYGFNKKITLQKGGDTRFQSTPILIHHRKHPVHIMIVHEYAIVHRVFI